MTPQDPLRMSVRDGLEMKYLPHYFQMHDRTNAERNMKSYKKNQVFTLLYAVKEEQPGAANHFCN